ncbi:uncharacterized protein LOC131238005, partial [Magnolia sinica]|uniref:uncharacterized protein LOC131238005 n=1 Tax=Magnolia sinica TaxID=86752 RepID=UPI00265B0575
NPPKKPDSVVSLFRNCGFSDTHIKSLVSLLPTLLSAHVEKTLLPKIRILQEIGLTGPVLAKVLVVNPTLLTVSAENKLLPSLNFLRTLIWNDGDVATVLKRSRWLFNAGDVQKQMQPNISTLQKYGVADERIKKLVVQSPRYLLRKPIWLEHNSDRVELEFGIPRGSGMFAYGVDVLCSLSKTTLEKKFQIFASFGWLESDTKTAFRNLPYCLALSEGKIRRGLNFWMKVLKYEPSFIARCPRLLMFNLETRIVPRHLVFEALKSKNLIKNPKNPSLHKIVCLREHRFLEDYVLWYISTPKDKEEWKSGSAKGMC